LNHDPPDRCLLSSWDYRREPPASACQDTNILGGSCKLNGGTLRALCVFSAKGEIIAIAAPGTAVCRPACELFVFHFKSQQSGFIDSKDAF
jgi:hypothetical protein